MSDNGETRLTAAERRLLIHGNPEIRREREKDLSRAERRRLDRESEREKERERSFASKLTTRADVIRVLELYTERKILPLAYDLDEVKMYAYAPIWRRWWFRRRRDWLRLAEWLDGKGIRFRRVDAANEDQEEP